MIAKKYLSVDELAEQSGISKATIWRLKREGLIPYYQPGGHKSRVLFPADALENGGAEAQNSGNTNPQRPNNPKPLSGAKPHWQRSR